VSRRTTYHPASLLTAYGSHLFIDQIGVIRWGARHLLARLIDKNGMLADAADRLHRNQKLRLSQTQEATGGDFQEAHPRRALINQHIITFADVLAILIHDPTTANVFGRIGHR